MEESIGKEAGRLKRKLSPALACLACRKKKVKCSGKPAPCSNCSQSEVECTFLTRTKPRRTPVRSARRIDALEDRLNRIEAMLNEVANPTPSAKSAASISHKEHPRHPSNGGNKPSPATTRTANSKVLLPPLSKALQLADRYFSTLNRFLPLFDEVDFMNEMQAQYSTLESASPTLWAAVNVVFALSHQMSAMEVKEDGIDHALEALGFVRNAISVVEELSTGDPSMLSAQSLIAIAKFWQATSTPQAGSTFLAMGTQHIYRLGLHRQSEQMGFSPDALEWRRRLLWMAYTVDKDYSLRLEQPHSLNDQDLNANLPAWNPRDRLGFLPTNIGQPSMNYFRLRVNLAIIQSKIYMRLYARHNPNSNLPVSARELEGVCDLVDMLLKWKSQIPVSFDPLELLSELPEASKITMAVLYLRYFNCLAMIHRLSYWKVGHLEAYKASLEMGALNPCPSHRMCIDSARLSLQIFTILPHGNVPCMWLLVDYFISAVVILLAGIIYHSSLTLGRQDLLLVQPVIESLGILARCGDTRRLEHIQANCIELENAAKNLLDKDGFNERCKAASAVRSSTFHNDQVLDWLYPDPIMW